MSKAKFTGSTSELRNGMSRDEAIDWWRAAGANILREGKRAKLGWQGKTYPFPDDPHRKIEKGWFWKAQRAVGWSVSPANGA